MQNKDNTLPLRPSRSQRKREVLALQDLGEILVDLPPAQLKKLPLDPKLAEAITTAQNLKSREAIRRQLQYIGKLMRNIDPQPIEEAIAKIQDKNRQGKAQFHQIEKWRDRFIGEGDKILEEFVQQYPDTDRQHLRQLVRRAQQDRAQNKNSGAETELFRLLRSIISQST